MTGIVRKRGFVTTRFWLGLLFALLATSWIGCELLSSADDDATFPEAARQHFDVAELELAFANADAIADLQGLAVARNDKIVAERYYNGAGPGPDSSLHVMSVTKSISSTLIGIAIDNGAEH